MNILEGQVLIEKIHDSVHNNYFEYLLSTRKKNSCQLPKFRNLKNIKQLVAHPHLHIINFENMVGEKTNPWETKHLH